MTQISGSAPESRDSAEDAVLAGVDDPIRAGEPITASIPIDLVVAYGVGNRVVWSADSAIEVIPGDDLDHD